MELLLIYTCVRGESGPQFCFMLLASINTLVKVCLSHGKTGLGSNGVSVTVVSVQQALQKADFASLLHSTPFGFSSFSESFGCVKNARLAWHPTLINGSCMVNERLVICVTVPGPTLC